MYFVYLKKKKCEGTRLVPPPDTNTRSSEKPG